MTKELKSNIVGVRLTNKELDLLDAYCDKLHRSKSSLLVDAMYSYFESVDETEYLLKIAKEETK